MNFCLYILKASIAILLASLGVYIAYFCFGIDGIDPVEIETIGMIIYTALGVFISAILIRRAGSLSTIPFAFGFIFYLLTWTLPALFILCYTLLIMTAG
jgi:hypothetical protein